MCVQMGTYRRDLLPRLSVYIRVHIVKTYCLDKVCTYGYIRVHTGCIVCIGGHCTMFRAGLTDLIDGILPGKNMSGDIM